MKVDRSLGASGCYPIIIQRRQADWELSFSSLKSYLARKHREMNAVPFRSSLTTACLASFPSFFCWKQ